MNPINRYSLALEALVELAPEIAAARADDRLPGRPASARIPFELASLPPEALFLGVAEDGLPVLLNLHDAVPGPLLVCGDPGCGKTAFLQMVAGGLVSMHEAGEVQFGVVTDHPEEWVEFERSAHCAGVFPCHENSAAEFIVSLGAWAHTNKSRQSVILLVDDLSQIEETEPEVRDNLRWLLLRGTSRGVWPIVTVNPANGLQILPWLDLFRTRIFGFIADARAAEPLTKSAGAGLSSLVKGSQFAMREGPQWLRFWIPNLDEGEPHEQRHALVR